MDENFEYYFNNFRKSPIFLLISKIMDSSRDFFQVFINHGIAVSSLALKATKNIQHFNPDVNLIFQGAMIHDIGCIFTNAPEIDCYGNLPYIQHGILGAEILNKEGLFKLASICENHIGVGIRKNEIIKNKIPLPLKNYIPTSIEEQCVAWADKFYSKTPGKLFTTKSLSKIVKNIDNISPDKKIEFLKWHEIFGKNIDLKN